MVVGVISNLNKLGACSYASSSYWIGHGDCQMEGFDLMELKPPKDLIAFFTSLGITAIDVGNDVKIRCVFHEDSDPSLQVRKKDGIFHCFGCGETGNFCKLLKELGVGHEDFLSTIDAVSDEAWDDAIEKILKKAVKKSDVKLHYENFSPLLPPPSGEAQKKNREIRMYLKGRGFGNRTIDFFGLGYVYPATKRNQRYFIRALIPVRDEQANLLWYEGRAIGEEKPKYYRPADTKVGDYFFNLHNAKFRFDACVVVEGVFDAIMLWQWGYNAVANFGTRVSDRKLNLLANFDCVYFCFDNDIKKTPKQKTAQQLQQEAMERAIGRGYNVYALTLPKGRDVCEVSKERFERVFDSAKIFSGEEK